jgi:hypothetical protein
MACWRAQNMDRVKLNVFTDRETYDASPYILIQDTMYLLIVETRLLQNPSVRKTEPGVILCEANDAR